MNKLLEYFKLLPTPARVLAGAIAMAMVLVVMLILLKIIGTYEESTARIDRSAPRIGRLLGYAEKEDALIMAEGEAGELVSRLAFTGDGDLNQVGAQLQQTLRGYAEDAGLTVSGSQLVSKDRRNGLEGFDTLAVELNMSGVPGSFDEFVGFVDSHQPLLKIADLVLSGQRQASTSRRRRTSEPAESGVLNIRVTVEALRVTRQ